MNKSTVSVDDRPAQIRENVKLLLSGVMILLGLYRGEWVLGVVGVMIALAWAVRAYLTWSQKRDISASRPPPQ